jgi:acyl-coenzyme A thioesterase PaaI-like protein
MSLQSELQPGLSGLEQLKALLASQRQLPLHETLGIAFVSAEKGVALELKVAYHRPITTKTGRVRAEGRVLSISRRAAFSEAKLTDASGKLLASATSSLILTPLGEQQVS